MSVSRERTIKAEICDVIETTPLNEPDGWHLASKIYDLVVKKWLRDSMKSGVEKTHDSAISDPELDKLFEDYLKRKV